MLFKIFSMHNSIWYTNLIKPPFSPQDGIFAPVWMFLYFSMALAILLYALKPVKNKKMGYIYFFAQLILNLLWMPAFFLMQNILLAFLIIILLDVFIFLTMKKFFSVCKIAGFLFVPYFLWALFATYLNLGYLLLN